jgi:hypothetical protein
MGKFIAKNLSQRELSKVLKQATDRNKELLRDLTGNALGRIMVNAGQLIEARAKEIITEKGHIVTGTLRRSINTQLQKAGVLSQRLTVEVGTAIHYAPYVEALPDGGYLFPASEQKFNEVTTILSEQGVVPALKKWSR